jgi:hypothetical protein
MAAVVTVVESVTAVETVMGMAAATVVEAEPVMAVDMVSEATPGMVQDTVPEREPWTTWVVTMTGPTVIMEIRGLRITKRLTWHCQIQSPASEERVI